MKEIVLGFHNSCFLNLSDSFSDGRIFYTVCQHSGVISCVPGRIDFCSYYFHIFRFSRSGRGEVDVYRFMSKVRLVQITMCFFVTITRHISPSMRHHTWSWCIEGQTFSYIFVVVFVLQTIWKSLFAAIGRKIYVISTECVAAVWLSFRYPSYSLDFQTIVDLSPKTSITGNSEFCSSQIWIELEGIIEIRGKQNSLFPKRQVIKW